jgi:cytochrome c
MTGRTVGVLVATSILIMLAAAAARAGGDAGRGEQIFGQDCRVCHSLEEGYQKEGPSLYEIWGKRAGTVPYFPHYKALKGANFVWNETTLDAWLANPRALANGKDTNMTFHLDSARDRADVVAYLKSLR